VSRIREVQEDIRVASKGEVQTDVTIIEASSLSYKLLTSIHNNDPAQAQQILSQAQALEAAAGTGGSGPPTTFNFERWVEEVMDQVEEGEVTETNGYLPPRKERCSYCGRSLPVKEMVYLKHLWFCGVRHYRAFFGISHRRTK